MDYTVDEVLRFVEENDVKFIKLSFYNAFGILKNVSILSSELPKVFEKGLSFYLETTDANGASGARELFLRPESGSLNVLPWRPMEGSVARLFCDIVDENGAPFSGDCRYILKQAVRTFSDLGYTCTMGPQCEFYLFQTDTQGNPTQLPQDNAGYLDAFPADKGENVRRDICLTLEQMSIDPESSHHERGPGQNEIDFKRSDVLRAADNLTTFKSVVKSIAERNGLYASFMPKPLADQCSSGMHIDVSVFSQNKNIFKGQNGALSEKAEAFIAGVAKHLKEIALFTNPYANSYERIAEFPSLKLKTRDGSFNPSILKIPFAAADNARINFCSPDASCNHYLTLALLLYAGMDGLQNNLKISDFESTDLIPLQLDEAMAAAKESPFIQKYIPRVVLDDYLHVKQREWYAYQKSNDSKAALHQTIFYYV